MGRLLHLDYLVQLLNFSPQRVVRLHPCRNDEGKDQVPKQVQPAKGCLKANRRCQD